ncbi:MAG: hypothetical protein IPK82_10405 [Polyangiaceae bacterium]|nr:hypothetical protein [Polyangiaceae bacterium]
MDRFNLTQVGSWAVVLGVLAGVTFGVGMVASACTDAQNDCNVSLFAECPTSGTGGGGATVLTSTTSSSGNNGGMGGMGGSSTSTGSGTTSTVMCSTAEDCKTLDPPSPCNVYTCEDGMCNHQSVDTDEQGCPSNNGQCVDGTCKLYLGNGCTDGMECQSGFCVDGFCCESECAGKCMACAESLTDLGNGLCSAVSSSGASNEDQMACIDKGGCGAVAGWCACEDGVNNSGETDIDCGGLCGDTCAVGQFCNANDDCKSGFCVNGICCNEDCPGPCRTCSAIKGICTLVTGQPSGCDTDNACAPDGTCKLANTQSCDDASECASGYCAGFMMFKACYGCSEPIPCGSNDACITNICYPAKLDKGDACVDKSQCKSENCVDGVCCDAECNGLCMACHNNYTDKPNGECAPMLIGYDPQGDCNGPGKAGTCNGSGACGVN